jgi:hypothetical protein
VAGKKKKKKKRKKLKKKKKEKAKTVKTTWPFWIAFFGGGVWKKRRYGKGVGQKRDKGGSSKSNGIQKEKKKRKKGKEGKIGKGVERERKI